MSWAGGRGHKMYPQPSIHTTSESSRIGQSRMSALTPDIAAEVPQQRNRVNAGPGWQQCISMGMVLILS